MGNRVYLYGMILVTNSFLMKNHYPAADTYEEVKEQYALPGGETGAGALVLENLGCRVKLDGNHMGRSTGSIIKQYFAGKDVDLSAITFDDHYEGLRDNVIICKDTRACFGTFNAFFSDQEKRWNAPSRENIQWADTVSLDPFFQKESEQAAKYCRELGKPYVTIDCPCDSLLNRLCSVNAVSHEYLKDRYPGIGQEELLKRYTEQTDGLVIFTNGSGEALYGRKGQPIKRQKAFRVQVVSTLGAGDTFRAGCVYALLKGMNDDEIVRFASAAAAAACTAFPLPVHPPTLEKIQFILGSGKQ